MESIVFCLLVGGEIQFSGSQIITQQQLKCHPDYGGHEECALSQHALRD